MTTIILFSLVAALATATVYLASENRKSKRRLKEIQRSDFIGVPVDPANRGPNADAVYLGIVTPTARYLFTEEAVANARNRASRFWQEKA